MAYPITTIDLPDSILQVQGGSFRLMPEGEYSSGQWATTPRATGPRFMRWNAEMDLLPFRKGANGDLRFDWEVFVTRLEGTAKAFRLYDPLRCLPRGAGAGIWNPRLPGGVRSQGEYTVDGSYLIDGVYHIDGGSTYAYVGTAADRYATSLHLTGLVPSTLVFKAGDQLSVGGNLHMIMDDATSDSSGETSVLISWRLWKPALVGDRVELEHPTGRFVLRSSDGGTMVRAFYTGQASISAIEVPYVE